MRFTLTKTNVSITIKKSFWILLCASLLSGYLLEFILLFTLTCFHETSHIFAAVCLDANISGITVMPLGVSAEIKNFDFLPTHKKIVILLSGPALNLALAVLALIFLMDKSAFFIMANLCIFIINMLPITPLDGGNLLFAIINNRLGILPSLDILAVTGRFFAVAIMIIGVVQVILYPYNISLISLGFFLFQTAGNKSTTFHNTFIKMLGFPTSKKNSTFMPVKHIALMSNCTIIEAIRLFGFNNYMVIHVVDGDGIIIEEITESEVIGRVMRDGVNGGML